MYDPQLGQWLSEDPIGFAGGQENLRMYDGNEPTSATDPTGLVIRFRPGTSGGEGDVQKAIDILEELRFHGSAAIKDEIARLEASDTVIELVVERNVPTLVGQFNRGGDHVIDIDDFERLPPGIGPATQTSWLYHEIIEEFYKQTVPSKKFEICHAKASRDEAIANWGWKRSVKPPVGGRDPDDPGLRKLVVEYLKDGHTIVVTITFKPTLRTDTANAFRGDVIEVGTEERRKPQVNDIFR